MGLLPPPSDKWSGPTLLILNQLSRLFQWANTLWSLILTSWSRVPCSTPLALLQPNYTSYKLHVQHHWPQYERSSAPFIPHGLIEARVICGSTSHSGLRLLSTVIMQLSHDPSSGHHSSPFSDRSLWQVRGYSLWFIRTEERERQWEGETALKCTPCRMWITTGQAWVIRRIACKHKPSSQKMLSVESDRCGKGRR